MGINFQFATTTRIIFGNDSFKKVPNLISGWGNHVFIVTGKRTELAQHLLQGLKLKGFNSDIISITSEPTTTDIEYAAALSKKNNCNIIIGIGGGSVIDAAKAIAVLSANKGELTDYLEIIGKGKKLEKSPLPFIAIPTTAGTGAEVTKNSVIKSIEKKVKVSLRSDLMFPAIAVVDPVLTLSMPPEITASTGIDALTHLLETFVSCQSNPFVDMLGREGMKRISNSLELAYSDGNNLLARADMAMASMLGGMALANVKLGAVHGFAGPMGGMFPIPHGAVCACLLPAVMVTNIGVLKEREMTEQLLKYEELARILTRNESAKAEEGAVWVKEMVKKLKIPSLSNYNLTENDFPELIEKAKNSSSMKGNPVVLNEEQLEEILYNSL
jgi:alcohol dehydrogenase class IV